MKFIQRVLFFISCIVVPGTVLAGVARLPPLLRQAPGRIRKLPVHQIRKNGPALFRAGRTVKTRLVM